MNSRIRFGANAIPWQARSGLISILRRRLSEFGSCPGVSRTLLPRSEVFSPSSLLNSAFMSILRAQSAGRLRSEAGSTPVPFGCHVIVRYSLAGNAELLRCAEFLSALVQSRVLVRTDGILRTVIPAGHLSGSARAGERIGATRVFACATDPQSWRAEQSQECACSSPFAMTQLVAACNRIDFQLSIGIPMKTFATPASYRLPAPR